MRTDAGRFHHLLVRYTEFESSDVVMVIHGWFTDGDYNKSSGTCNRNLLHTGSHFLKFSE